MAWAIDSGKLECDPDYNFTRDIQLYRHNQLALNYVTAMPENPYLFTRSRIHIKKLKAQIRTV